MEENKVKIDLGALLSTVWKRKFLFLKVWVITFILSCAWILPQPRYYTADLALTPETSSEAGAAGGLSSIMSSFGINTGGGASSDAIFPMLYPDLFNSPEFTVGLFDVIVKTEDGKIKTDYYNYLAKYQQQNPLTQPFKDAMKKVKDYFSPPPPSFPQKPGQRFDPFRLDYNTTMLVKAVRANIQCSYSKTTDVITLTVRDQDPLVCATMADSVRGRLQNFITDYRTRKARHDMEHYRQLADEALADYEKKSAEYAAYADTHFDNVLSTAGVKETQLENEMQTAYQMYTQYQSQAQLYEGKVQERTPVFVVLKSPTVPVKPAGPKRMIFVAAMLFLATIGTFSWIFRKELKEWF